MHFENNEVGIVIRRLRNDRKFSQEMLSQKAGVARSHISMIESGTKKANFETLCKLADALNLRPSALVHIIENESEHYKSPLAAR